MTEMAPLPGRVDALERKTGTFEELKNHMLVLHESVIERIKWLGEGRRKRR